MTSVFDFIIPLIEIGIGRNAEGTLFGGKNVTLQRCFVRALLILARPASESLRPRDGGDPISISPARAVVR